MSDSKRHLLEGCIARLQKAIQEKNERIVELTSQRSLLDEQLDDAMQELASLNDDIRPERTFEVYSRGPQLVRAIQALWEGNVGLSGEAIDSRIRGLMAEYDLSLPEWHYWARQVRSLDGGSRSST